MPDYVTMTAITGMIPGKYLIEALDEDGDGQADPAAWSRVAARVKAAIDDMLEKRFDVPFENPLPALVVQSAKILALEKLYALCKRTGADGTPYNPAATTADMVRAQLKAVAAGAAPLYPQREVPAAAPATPPAEPPPKKTAT